jgi:hypothetical protein
LIRSGFIILIHESNNFLIIPQFKKMGCACCSSRPAEVLPPEEPGQEKPEPTQPVTTSPPSKRTPLEMKLAPSPSAQEVIDTVDLAACKSKEEMIRYLGVISPKEKAEQVLVNMRGTIIPREVQTAIQSFLDSAACVRGFLIDFSENRMGTFNCG